MRLFVTREFKTASGQLYSNLAVQTRSDVIKNASPEDVDALRMHVHDRAAQNAGDGFTQGRSLPKAGPSEGETAPPGSVPGPLTPVIIPYANAPIAPATVAGERAREIARERARESGARNFYFYFYLFFYYFFYFFYFNF